MPKLKRASEQQLSKGAYEAAEDGDRFAEAPDPGRGMTRAGKAVLATRKILRVSRCDSRERRAR